MCQIECRGHHCRTVDGAVGEASQGLRELVWPVREHEVDGDLFRDPQYWDKGLRLMGHSRHDEVAVRRHLLKELLQHSWPTDAFEDDRARRAGAELMGRR